MLGDSLRNELKRHANQVEETQIDEQDEEKKQTLDALRETELLQRVTDIVHVHVASSVAQNALNQSRPYRSHDDADESMHEPSYMKKDLMDEYGIAKAWGAEPDNKIEEVGYFGDDLADAKSNNSEMHHYQTEVKRRNLIDLFLDNLQADKFVATHLYGHL